MKKAMLLTGAFLTLMTTIAFGTVESKRFVNSIEKQIYRNANTGKLTSNEVRVINNLLYAYEDKVYEFSAFGRLTNQEQRRLLGMEERIIEKLEQLTYNRVTVRAQRYNTPVVVYSESRNRYPTTRSTVNRRGTYCPAPRGRY